jgi:putative ABC transport system permease protein
MLETFETVMNVITMGVAAIAGISLLVGAIGTLTMMWITVNERVHEIGLMRALGATGAQVQRLFLLEAIILTVLGGVLGIVAGLALADFLRVVVPGLPAYTPLRYILAALLVSLVTGLLSGVIPARRASSLDPIEALRAE